MNPRALEARARRAFPDAITARRARKKALSACVVVDHRSASRAWRAHDDDATHVTDPAPSVRFSRASRLSSAARPPVSSAARLSRYAPCDAHRGNYFGTLSGSAETVALREGRRSSRREGIDRSLTLSFPRHTRLPPSTPPPRPRSRLPSTVSAALVRRAPAPASRHSAPRRRDGGAKCPREVFRD